MPRGRLIATISPSATIAVAEAGSIATAEKESRLPDFDERASSDSGPLALLDHRDMQSIAAAFQVALDRRAQLA